MINSILNKIKLDIKPDYKFYLQTKTQWRNNMNKKALKTLEYNKIIDKLVDLAVSGLGKEKAKNLIPMTDINEIKISQQETGDALSRI